MTDKFFGLIELEYFFKHKVIDTSKRRAEAVEASKPKRDSRVKHRKGLSVKTESLDGETNDDENSDSCTDTAVATEVIVAQIEQSSANDDDSSTKIVGLEAMKLIPAAIIAPSGPLTTALIHNQMNEKATSQAEIPAASMPAGDEFRQTSQTMTSQAIITTIGSEPSLQPIIKASQTVNSQAITTTIGSEHSLQPVIEASQTMTSQVIPIYYSANIIPPVNLLDDDVSQLISFSLRGFY